MVSSSYVTISLLTFFFFSSRRRHTRYWRDRSSDVVPSDLRQLVFGQVDNLGLNVLLRRLARFFLHKIAEIVGRQVTFLREIFYRRQPFTQGTALPEVVVKQAFKLIKHVKIGRTAGDELPLIEAQTIVEQQFYVAADELSAVLVNGMVQLLLYLGKAIAEDGFLVFRQVQGLA